MAKPRNALTKWSQYVAARLGVMGLTMFDVEANLQTAAWLGRLLYRFDHRHRHRATRNIALSFPQWSPAQVDRVCRQSFEHFVHLLVEILHTPRLLHDATWSTRTRLTNLGPAIKLMNAAQPTLMVTGHLGNWEVLGYLLAVLGYRIHAIARPLDNPLVSDWLFGIREKRGMKIITKWNATDRMINVLNSGGTLGFIADQNAGDKGMFVPFFGRLASSYKSIGLLAMNQKVPIVCGYSRRVGNGFDYEMSNIDIIYPEDWANRRDPLFYITARYNRAMEMMIRQCPQQYLWMHRRWKSRPRFERLGRPMPSVLRRNLEELPWMDQPTLNRLLDGGNT